MINSSVNDIKTLDKNQLKPKLHILIRVLYYSTHNSQQGSTTTTSASIFKATALQLTSLWSHYHRIYTRKCNYKVLRCVPGTPRFDDYMKRCDSRSCHKHRQRQDCLQHKEVVVNSSINGDCSSSVHRSKRRHAEHVAAIADSYRFCMSKLRKRNTVGGTMATEKLKNSTQSQPFVAQSCWHVCMH